MALPLMPECSQGCGAPRAQLSYDFPADIEALPAIVEEVTGLAARRWGADSDKAAQVALALQEALANAVVHGCGEDTSKRVQCWVAEEPAKGLIIMVRDPGPGFDAAHPPDALGEQGRTLDHGRGVLLMKQLMDHVHFMGRGNEVHMTLA